MFCTIFPFISKSLSRRIPFIQVRLYIKYLMLSHEAFIHLFPETQFICMYRNRGPVKGLVTALRQFARVVMVNEFRTSKICPAQEPGEAVCDSVLTSIQCKGVRQGQQVVWEPYALKLCPQCTMVSSILLRMVCVPDYYIDPTQF